jgi:hypothetical protein
MERWAASQVVSQDCACRVEVSVDRWDPGRQERDRRAPEVPEERVSADRDPAVQELSPHNARARTGGGQMQTCQEHP